MTEDQGTRRALIVAAHPDDGEFGAAGTIAEWSKEGWEFYYLICTNGAKGSSDPNMTAERLVPTREREQRAAAARLGAKDVFFLGFEDGELLYTREFLGRVVRVIREVRPFAVFTHDPETLFHKYGDDEFSAAINHSDHRASGLATVDAVYPTARDRLNFPEHLQQGLEPHKVSEIYMWGSNNKNFDVDITDVLDLKVESLMAHESQFPEGAPFFERVREFWRGEEGRYVESFRKVILPF